jgi:hypothetical protein
LRVTLHRYLGFKLIRHLNSLVLTRLSLPAYYVYGVNGLFNFSGDAAPKARAIRQPAFSALKRW